MLDARYIERRGQLQTYFDRTAVEAWKRFATDAPLNRIRETVRAGRERMRALLLSYLPEDLSGWRILDAGCGAGVLSVALAERGAEVLGIDLSAEMVRFAEASAPSIRGGGKVEFQVGDMLDPNHGRFDAAVAMDSLIHYKPRNSLAALSVLAAHTERSLVFTFAPATPTLSAMHTVGRIFPRSNRAPSIVPTRASDLIERLNAAPAFADWRTGRSERIKSGFYTSQALEVTSR